MSNVLHASVRVALTIVCVTVVSAQIDPRQMAGIPRPVDDLPSGSVSVRLIRGQLSNNISGHPVDLQVDDKVVTVKTDDGGRAQFDKLRPGATLKAVAVVDGERLESQTFQAPGQGGIRVMLVATDSSRAEAAAPAPAAVPGQIVLGGETRIVVEGADEALEVYYLLDIENRAAEPVNPAAPFAFEMPVVGTLLNGSSKLAAVEGRRVQVNGPFPPGRTLVQVAFRLPVTSGSLNIEQAFPAPLERLVVLVKKTGDMRLSSPLIQRQQDFPSEGTTVIGAMGGAVSAGQPIALTLEGLPHHSQAPRLIALSLAGIIILAGVWTARKPESDSVDAEAARKKLVGRREKLFNELVRIEKDHRQGRIDDERYVARREELVTGLEQIYLALDDSTDQPGAAA